MRAATHTCCRMAHQPQCVRPAAMWRQVGGRGAARSRPHIVIVLLISFSHKVKWLKDLVCAYAEDGFIDFGNG